MEKVKEKSNTGKKISIILILCSVALSYYVYNVLHTAPEMPKIDMDAYWGHYPLDSKPDLSIKPFYVEFSVEMIRELRNLLLHRRQFVPPIEDAGFNYGFNSNFLTQVLDYWQNKYNFAEREKFLNKYNHYKTKIQGLDIHFVHVKPEVTGDVDVVPLLLLHGWPGSFREFYELIEELSPKPDQSFALELIIPSLPGYGYSQAAVRSGMGPLEIGVVMHKLMNRLGHSKYYIQGGDIGHIVGSAMATVFPENVLGFHSNMPVLSFTPLTLFYTILGNFVPSLLVENEIYDRVYPLGKYFSFLMEESGYYHLQSTKPDTVGIALTDSPAGLAAYILEKFSTWTNPNNRNATDGNLLSKYMLVHLLDNIMVYWSSNCITTSMRLYKEHVNSKYGAIVSRIPTKVPTCGIKFKYELMTEPDGILKLKYHNYLHTTVVDGGGHFAALESPAVLAKDILQAITTFREFWGEKKPQHASQGNPLTANTVYEFSVTDLYGRNVKLEKYRGNVLLIVNVASQCGLTLKNYKQLKELHEKYADRNFKILAFPCNQFNGQEPGTSSDIIQFINEKEVKFDVFQKIEVNGENAHPLWKYLKQVQSGTFGDFVKWNFSKFIVDKNGVPVERFGPNVDPIDLEPEITKYL
ncbi:juvenile hormone epoxide hydrolase-like [Leptidea sinapis]|uniref:juvenile hormone epoxide hydrolase-like n=1 Tax=Leptidea sinapis TaxID=189913 RepID=UPI00211FDFD6|nr:juvenile hormone epoxide hydrolase-like [Leptidea sinapis]